MDDRLDRPISKHHSQFIYIVLRLRLVQRCHVQESFVETHHFFPQSPNLFEKKKANQQKTFKRGHYPLPKKVSRCSVDANYKDGPGYARKDCLHAGNAKCRMREQEEMVAQKGGIVRCCIRQSGLYPIVVIVMHVKIRL
jgi:hypothetical protein